MDLLSAIDKWVRPDYYATEQEIEAQKISAMQSSIDSSAMATDKRNKTLLIIVPLSLILMIGGLAVIISISNKK